MVEKCWFEEAIQKFISLLSWKKKPANLIVSFPYVLMQEGAK